MGRTLIGFVCLFSVSKRQKQSCEAQIELRGAYESLGTEALKKDEQLMVTKKAQAARQKSVWGVKRRIRIIDPMQLHIIH